MSKLGIIGDLHLKQELSYADIVTDRRVAEKKEILDFIVEQLNDCDKIIFLGDQLNARNNLSSVNKELVELLERFDGKELFLISGNHERNGDGTTAIDFLKEVKNKKWHIITDGLMTIGDYDFLPYKTKQELGTTNPREAAKKVMETLEGNKILFCHYAISSSKTVSETMVDMFDEIILPKEELEKKYEMIIGGHIHQYQRLSEKIIVTGSIFTAQIGEHEKFIWKINEDTSTIEQIKLPARGIYKIENPTKESLEKEYPLNSIIKVILTDKNLNKENIIKMLKKFDASIILENYLNIRKKVIQTNEDVLDMSIEKLLNLYSKEKKVELSKLLKAWELIKN